MDETITLSQYATQSFMFCTFISYTLLLKLFHTGRWKKLKSSTIMERPIQLLLHFQASKVLNLSSLHWSGNGSNNYTLWVYYSEFLVLHIRQVYISIKLFWDGSTKITQVLNIDEASYAIIVRFPPIQSGHFVKLIHKR